MKRLIQVANILIVAVLLLSACGPTPTPEVVEKEVLVEVTKVVEKVVTATPEPTQPPAEGAKIILRVGTGDSGEGLKPHQEIIAKFEDENPDILVQLEAVAGSDYYTRLFTQMAADDAPDIMQVGDGSVFRFVSSGAFALLDDFITGDYPLDTSIYLPGVLEPGQVDGQQWMLPKDSTPMAVYYNKKIFDQYGVDYPQGNYSACSAWIAKSRPGATRDADS